MNPSTPLRVAGVDVGKSHLDAHILDGSHERRFDNTKVGRRALRNWLLKHGVERVVFEPTGRFHRNLHQCLGDAGLQTVLVNPLRSRRFAEAIEVLAKNDRVDAAMLARFGRLDGLEGTPPPSRNLVLLSDLLALCRKLRDELDPELRGGADAAVDSMRDAIADCDGRMRACIAADAELARRAAIVESIPGFGIAPFDADSGGHRDPLRSRLRRLPRAPRRSQQVPQGCGRRRHAPPGDPAHSLAARRPALATGSPRPHRGGRRVIAALPSREIRPSEHSSALGGLTSNTEAFTSPCFSPCRYLHRPLRLLPAVKLSSELC